jgi:hypothetical protein
MSAKRGPGRPKLFEGDSERKTVHLLPEVSAKVAAIGDGSLSQGIDRLAYRVPDKPRPPKQRYVVITDADEIEAVKRSGLRDPIGGLIDGKWYAEWHSLMQYRKKSVEFDV